MPAIGLRVARLKAGDTIAERYRVVRALGEGGMGSVYEVEDALSARRLALKTIAPAVEAGQFLPCLRHEFQALAALDHPNVIRVHDFHDLGTDGCCFTMERVEGGDLLDATLHAPWETVADLLVQVCRGLAYIHARGLLHGDLKPPNVLVQSGPTPRAIISDLGLASRRPTGPLPSVRGTPHYMAPEPILGRTPDPRSDVYSLGVTIYEVLTGRTPFEGGSTADVLRAHLDRTPAPPTPRREDFPPAMVALVLALLAKDPADRPRDAGAVGEELDRILGHRPGGPAIRTQAAIEAWLCTPALVGREAALATLKDLAARVLARPPAAGVRVTFLEGTSGMGKSRLLRELRHRVQLEGGLWCEARAAQTAGGYAPVQRLIDALEASREGGPAPAPPAGLPLPTLLAGGRWKETLAPAAWPASPEAVRHGLHAEFLGRLHASARRGPTVLCLDDLHAADEGTLEVVMGLCGRLRGDVGSLALVAAYSPEEAPAALVRLVEGAERTGSAGRIVLGPLSPAEVETLVRSMLPLEEATGARLAAVAAEASAGNPLHVEETVRHALETGCLVAAGRRLRLDGGRLEGLGTSASLGRLMAERLVRTPPGARSALEALACLGGPGDLELLGAVSGLDLAGLTAELAALARSGTVRWAPEGSGWTLTQPALQGAILGGLTRRRRVALHRAILAVLLGRRGSKRIDPGDPDIEVLAGHALEASDRWRAARYAAAAARRCRTLRLPGRALVWGRQALRRMGRAPPRERVDLLVLCVGSALFVGRSEEALEAADQALALARQTGDAVLVGLALLARGRVRSSQGGHREAVECLEAARTVFERAGDAVHLTVSLKHLGREHLLLEETALARPLLEEAFRRLMAEGRKDWAGYTRVEMGECARMEQRYDEALADYASGSALLEEAGDALGMSQTLAAEGRVLEYRGDLAGALEVSRRALAAVRGEAAPRHIAYVLGRIGGLELTRGRTREALSAFGEVLGLEEGYGDPVAIAQARRNIASALHHEGDLRGAWRHLRGALTLVHGRDIQCEASILRSAASLRALRGHYRSALPRYRESLRLAQESGLGSLVSAALLSLSLLYTTLGDPEAARAELAAVKELLPGLDFRSHDVLAQALEGHLALEAGDPDEAAGLLGRAAEAARGQGEESTLAFCLDGLARAHLGEGDLAAASASLSELEAIGGRSGSVADRATAGLLRGRMEREVGALRESRRVLEHALALGGPGRPIPPELFWRLHRELALCHEDSGRLEDARRSALRALGTLRRLWHWTPAPYREAYLATPERRKLCEDARRLGTA